MSNVIRKNEGKRRAYGVLKSRARIGGIATSEYYSCRVMQVCIWDLASNPPWETWPRLPFSNDVNSTLFVSLFLSLHLIPSHPISSPTHSKAFRQEVGVQSQSVRTMVDDILHK